MATSTPSLEENGITLQTNILIQISWDSSSGDLKLDWYNNEQRETMTVSHDHIQLLSYAAEPKSKTELEEFIHNNCSFTDSPEDVLLRDVEKSLLLSPTHPIIEHSQNWMNKGWRQALYYTLSMYGNEISDVQTQSIDDPTHHLEPTHTVQLPKPHKLPDRSLVEVLLNRRTCREFEGEAINPQALATILDATFNNVVSLRNQSQEQIPVYKRFMAYGIYPIVFVVRVNGIQPGLYHYDERKNAIKQYRGFESPSTVDDLLQEMMVGQQAVTNGAVGVLFAADLDQCLELATNGKALASLYSAAAVFCQRFLVATTAVGFRTWQAAAFDDSIVLEEVAERAPLHFAVTGPVTLTD